MKRVKIKNFGAISKVVIDLEKGMQVLIGEQASGKSTICKTIYYCLRIRDYTLDFLMNKEQFLNNHPNEHFNNYMKYLQKQFMGCFGKTRHMRNFEIEYAFDGERIIVKRNDDGFIRFIYSEKLKNEIKKLLENANEMHNNGVSKDILSVFDQIQALAIMKSFFQERLHDIFCSNSEIVYIPAGRSLLASMSEQLDYSVSEMDLTMQDFIMLIKSTKGKFGSKIPEMEKTYAKTVKGQLDSENLRAAYKLIRQILKADYTSESDGEKIYFDDSHWVKLMYGSSGQQEILWILLLSYIFILEKRKVFMVIEEPEAHLFPQTQKWVVELISLMNNATGSSTIITTHSPYILTSLNILLFSYKAENNKKGESIIPRNLRLPFDKFGAFLIDSGNVRENMVNLMDEETNMIDTVYIDSVSSITNTELNRLIEKEISNDM